MVELIIFMNAEYEHLYKKRNTNIVAVAKEHELLTESICEY